MPRCENCGTDWEGGHLCINPHLSGVLNPWSRFTDAELAVLEICTAIPPGLQETAERMATGLTTEITARQSSGGTT